MTLFRIRKRRWPFRRAANLNQQMSFCPSNVSRVSTHLGVVAQEAASGSSDIVADQIGRTFNQIEDLLALENVDAFARLPIRCLTRVAFQLENDFCRSGDKSSN